MGQIHVFFRSLGKSMRWEELAGLIHPPKCAHGAYLSKGGISKLTSESAISLCRMMGLKLPYSPVKLALFETKWGDNSIIIIFDILSVGAIMYRFVRFPVWENPPTYIDVWLLGYASFYFQCFQRRNAQPGGIPYTEGSRYFPHELSRWMLSQRKLTEFDRYMHISNCSAFFGIVAPPISLHLVSNLSARGTKRTDNPIFHNWTRCAAPSSRFWGFWI